jgi:hypothetical protein
MKGAREYCRPHNSSESVAKDLVKWLVVATGVERQYIEPAHSSRTATQELLLETNRCSSTERSSTG